MLLLYREVPDKWDAIGRYLEIRGAELNAIGQKHQNDAHKCLMAMFDEWLAHNNPPPTWEAIADAVEFVQKPNLAMKIRDKHIPG